MFDKRWLDTKISDTGNLAEARDLFDDFLVQLGIPTCNLFSIDNISEAKKSLLELDEKHRRVLDDLEKVQCKIKQLNKEHEGIRMSLGISYDDWMKEHCKKEVECSPDEEHAGLRVQIYRFLDIMQPLLGQERALLALNHRYSWDVIMWIKDNVRIINKKDLCALQKKQQ